jgi:hypothetical protein
MKPRNMESLRKVVLERNKDLDFDRNLLPAICKEWGAQISFGCSRVVQPLVFLMGIESKFFRLELPV